MILRQRSLGLKQRLRMQRLKLKHRTALLKLFRKRKQIILDPSKRRSLSAMKKLSELSQKLMSSSEKLQLLKVRLSRRIRSKKILAKQMHYNSDFSRKSKLANITLSSLESMMFAQAVIKISQSNTKRVFSKILMRSCQLKTKRLVNSMKFSPNFKKNFLLLMKLYSRLPIRILFFLQRTHQSHYSIARSHKPRQRLKELKMTLPTSMKRSPS